MRYFEILGFLNFRIFLKVSCISFRFLMLSHFGILLILLTYHF